MKRMNFGESKLAGKGFYIALAISIVGVGSAALIAVSRTQQKLNDPTLQAPNQSVSSGSEAVVKPESKVPVSSAPPVSSEAPVPSETPEAPESESDTNTTNVFAKPLGGEIINKFSGGELVKSKTTKDWFTHDGIDIKAAEDTPVKSCANGIVKEIKEDARWGVCIIIDHYNGIEGHYYNLANTVEVKKNQEVEVGQVIGKVGKTAEVEMKEEPHLHFAIMKDGKWIDPIEQIPSLKEN